MTRGTVALCCCVAIQALVGPAGAFQGPALGASRTISPSSLSRAQAPRPLVLGAAAESASFVPPPVDDDASSKGSEDQDGAEGDEDVLDKVEQLGRGGAKVRIARPFVVTTSLPSYTTMSCLVTAPCSHSRR